MDYDSFTKEILRGKYLCEPSSSNSLFFPAIHTRLKRICCLKKIVLSSAEEVEQFRQIACKMDAVGRHQNIEDIYDLIEVDHGFGKEKLVYLELEWCGEWWRDMSGDYALPPLSEVQCIQFVKAVIVLIRALVYAHEVHHYYHRNIMWRYLYRRESQDPVLTGFGHAAFISEDADCSQIGLSEGGETYLSPWQADGTVWDSNCNEAILVRNDIWGIAATAYHIITGQALHHSTDLHLAKKRVQGDLNLSLLRQAVPDKRIFAILQMCFAKDLNKGYCSMRDLQADLSVAVELAENRSVEYRLWPGYTSEWFGKSSEMVHDYQDARGRKQKEIIKREVVQYLKRLNPEARVPFASWLADAEFTFLYEELKNFIGSHSRLQGGGDDTIGGRLPTMGSVLLLLYSCQTQILSEWKTITWENLINRKLLPEVSRHEARQALLCLYDIFSGIECQKFNPICPGVSGFALLESSLRLQLSFDCENTLDGRPGLKAAVETGTGGVSCAIRRFNRIANGVSRLFVSKTEENSFLELQLLDDVKAQRYEKDFVLPIDSKSNETSGKSVLVVDQAEPQRGKSIAKQFSLLNGVQAHFYDGSHITPPLSNPHELSLVLLHYNDRFSWPQTVFYSGGEVKEEKVEWIRRNVASRGCFSREELEELLSWSKHQKSLPSLLKEQNISGSLMVVSLLCQWYMSVYEKKQLESTLRNGCDLSADPERGMNGWWKERPEIDDVLSCAIAECLQEDENVVGRDDIMTLLNDLRRKQDISPVSVKELHSAIMRWFT